ncbi:hypothetical protein AcV7_007463 [Taiwanofungus camphoratus]|nr:hypothetical protein AcV7_007463 [Antrodia cinnamomea]
MRLDRGLLRPFVPHSSRQKTYPRLSRSPCLFRPPGSAPRGERCIVGLVTFLYIHCIWYYYYLDTSYWARCTHTGIIAARGRRKSESESEPEPEPEPSQRVGGWVCRHGCGLPCAATRLAAGGCCIAIEIDIIMIGLKQTSFWARSILAPGPARRRLPHRGSGARAARIRKHMRTRTRDRGHTRLPPPLFPRPDADAVTQTPPGVRPAPRMQSASFEFASHDNLVAGRTDGRGRTVLQAVRAGADAGHDARAIRCGGDWDQRSSGLLADARRRSSKPEGRSKPARASRTHLPVPRSGRLGGWKRGRLCGVVRCGRGDHWVFLRRRFEKGSQGRSQIG